MGHARALLGVDDAEIQRKLAKSITEKGISVRETERTIRKIINGGDPASTNSAAAKEDANVRSAEAKLRRKLSSKVQIINNPSGEGGKIEIEFYDVNDLNRIYEIIMGKNSQDEANG